MQKPSRTEVHGKRYVAFVCGAGMRMRKSLVIVGIALSCLTSCGVTPSRHARFTVYDERIFDSVRNDDLLTVQALVRENHRIVDACLEYKSVHKPSRADHFSPLHFACLYQRYQIAEFLLANGADADSDAGGGWTPLHEACFTGFPPDDGRLARLLLKNGADVRARWKGSAIYTKPLDIQPIHVAAERGRLSVLKVLLENGASAKASDGEGKNALNHALEAGEHEVADFLAKELGVVPSTQIRKIKLLPEWRRLKKAQPNLPAIGGDLEGMEDIFPEVLWPADADKPRR